MLLSLLINLLAYFAVGDTVKNILLFVKTIIGVPKNAYQKSHISELHYNSEDNHERKFVGNLIHDERIAPYHEMYYSLISSHDFLNGNKI